MSNKCPKIPQRRISRKYFIQFLHADLSVRKDRPGEYNYYSFDTFSWRIIDEQSYMLFKITIDTRSSSDEHTNTQTH
jgi:hypothetical protein